MRMPGTKRTRAFVLPYVLMMAVVLIAIMSLIIAHAQAVASSTQAESALPKVNDLPDRNRSLNAPTD